MENFRIAVITRLVEKSPKLGRTALMKYCYFLQALRRVPLGYSFSLYSYGPFDSSVLSDLDATEAVAGVTSQVVYFSGGYGYEISPGPRAEQAKRWGGLFLQKHEPDLDWVIREFGNLGAAELELASTIIYSDREAKANSECVTPVQLSRRVHDIKPHFSEAQITALIERLNNSNLLLTQTWSSRQQVSRD